MFTESEQIYKAFDKFDPVFLTSEFCWSFLIKLLPTTNEWFVSPYAVFQKKKESVVTGEPMKKLQVFTSMSFIGL